MRRAVTRRLVLGAGLAAAAAPFAARAEVRLPDQAHIVLLGDSTLDNAAYVSRGDDVASLLSAMVPRDWRVTLLAVDGGVTADVPRQLGALPAGATHLVVSVGGNDALRYSGILQDSAGTMAIALEKLARVREEFASGYRAMLTDVLARGLPTGIATIYDPAFPDPAAQRVAATALTVLNDVITRAAARSGTPLLDLRVIFDSPQDYANPIEPSAAGGRKLAAAIVALVSEHDFGLGRSGVFISPS